MKTIKTMASKRNTFKKTLVNVGNIESRYLDRENESLMSYLESVRKFSVLTPNDEINLIKEYKLNGSKEARDIVIKANLRFVISLAKKYCPSTMNICDLITEGNIGLIQALENYNIESNVKLVNYASGYIVKYIFEYLANNNMIKQANRDRVHGTVDKIEEEFFKKNGYYPNSDELMDAFSDKGWTPKSKKDLDRITIVSLDRLPNNDSDDDFVVEYGSEDENIGKSLSVEIIKKQICSIMECLTDSERLVITRKFGLDGNIETSDSLIALEMGITEHKVNKIYSSAISKLQKYKHIFE